MERITSDERLIMIKEEENKFLDKLDGMLNNISQIIKVGKDQAFLFGIIDNFKKSRNLEIELDSAIGLSIAKHIDQIRIAMVAERLFVNEEIVKNELKWLKAINTMNQTLFEAVKACGITLTLDIIDEFVEKNEDLFSVSKLKRELAIEDRERYDAAQKVIEKDKKVEEKPAMPKPKEYTEEELEKMALANNINAKFFEFNQIKKDLPYTRNTKELSATLYTRIVKFGKNYRPPLNASKSLGCLKQANIEINKMEKQLSNIKEIVNYSAILAGLELK